jgi:hypothetical protein
MSSVTISQANELIWELLEALEDAYWEASTCEDKDCNFNMLQVLNAEYMELLKVSVQDHHYEYEVISTSQDAMIQALAEYQQFATNYPHRLRTQQRLRRLLSQFSSMVTPVG